jgi:hypothetical protein
METGVRGVALTVSSQPVTISPARARFSSNVP